LAPCKHLGLPLPLQLFSQLFTRVIQTFCSCMTRTGTVSLIRPFFLPKPHGILRAYYVRFTPGFNVICSHEAGAIMSVALYKRCIHALPCRCTSVFTSYRYAIVGFSCCSACSDRTSNLPPPGGGRK